eukprot:gene7974-8833_t
MVNSQAKRRKQIEEKKKKLPEIVVQDFGEDMFDLGTPKDVEHMYKFVLSPRHSPAAATKWNNGLDINLSEKLDIPYDMNSCVLFSPSIAGLNNRADCENWDAIFHANGAEDLLNGPEKKLTDSFLTELGLKSPHSKVTLFSPKFPDNLFSENFLQEIGLNHGEVTLVSPKQANLISNRTPVVVKRQNEGKCELGIYLPPCYTPALLDSIRSTINEEDLTMFPFPPVSEDSVSDCSHLEDVEDMEMDLPHHNPRNFFTCTQNSATTVNDRPSSCNDMYNNGYNKANLINCNDNNHTVIVHNKNTCINTNNTIINNNNPNLINNNSIVHNNNNNNTYNNNNNNNNGESFQRGVYTQLGASTSIQQSMQQGMTLPGSLKCPASLVSNQKELLAVERPKPGNKRKSKSVVKGKKVTELRKQFTEVRTLHNDVERKRRGEMHSKFQKLRESIPEIETDKKAAKITILRVARRFITELEEESKKIEQIKEYEKSKNRELLNRLCNLTQTATLSKA